LQEGPGAVGSEESYGLAVAMQRPDHFLLFPR